MEDPEITRISGSQDPTIGGPCQDHGPKDHPAMLPIWRDTVGATLTPSSSLSGVKKGVQQ
jgi:hypothetical protein